MFCGFVTEITHLPKCMLIVVSAFTLLSASLPEKITVISDSQSITLITV